MWSAGSEPRRRRVRAFTLLELLVVLAVAGLLVAVVPPLFSRALPGVQLKQTTHMLVAGLRHTRDLALRQRRAQRLELDLRERRVTVPGRQAPASIPAGIELDLVTAASEYDANTGRGAIRYFPDGSSTGGRITLSSRSARYAVDIDWLTGRVSIL